MADARFASLQGHKYINVETFRKNGQGVRTPVWFALRLGPREFGIFDAFPDDAARKAHLSGSIAAALMAKASELLAEPPRIEQVDVLAAKVTTA